MAATRLCPGGRLPIRLCRWNFFVLQSLFKERISAATCSQPALGWSCSREQVGSREGSVEGEEL